MVQSVSNEDLASMVVKLSADLTVYSKEMSKVAGIAEKAINGAAKAWGAGNEKMAGQTTKAAQQMDRAYRAAGASAGNMAAQVQDIGIQLQSGTSPITVALQQGTQIGQIFAQAGQQGGNAFTVMLGALKNLLSPAAILPILFIAIGGAVIQAFSKSKKSIEETLKELENLKKIANEIGAEKLAFQIQVEIDTANIEQNIAALKQRIADAIAAEGGGKSTFQRAWNATFDFLNQTPEQAFPTSPFKAASDAIGEVISQGQKVRSIWDDLNQLNMLRFEWRVALETNDVDTADEKFKAIQALLADLAEKNIPEINDALKVSKTTTDAWAKSAENIKATYDAANDAILKEINNTEDMRKKTKELADAVAEMQKIGEAHRTDVERLYDAWVRADAAATTYDQKRANAVDFRRGQQELINQALQEGSKDTTDFIKKWEGFTPTAHWDVNAFRVGFGSDRFVDEAGKVQTVLQSTIVTVEQATKDLARRIPEFQAIVQRSLGSEFWNKLNEDQKTALTSLTYNYGHVPKEIVAAINAGGGSDAIAKAIQDLNKIPGTVNFDRRQAEGALFGGEAFKRTAGLQEEVDKRRELVAVTKEEIAIKNDLSLSYEQQQGAIARLRAERELEADLTKNGTIPLTAEHSRLIKEAGQAAYEAAAATAADTEAKRNNKVWTDALNAANKDFAKSQEQAGKQAQQNAQQYAQLGSQFISTFTNGLRQGKSATEALTDALVNLADQLLSMALNQALTSLFSQFKLPALGAAGGGLVGSSPGSTHRLSPFAFAGAPRMARGGFVGVRPGEFPTILHKGEAVIPASMVRQAARMGSGASGGQGNTTVRVGDIAISTNIDGTGDVKADSARGKQMGLQLKALITTEIQRQSRPGGLLTAQGSGFRVGR